jgi:hypothetical protein
MPGKVSEEFFNLLIDEIVQQEDNGQSSKKLFTPDLRNFDALLYHYSKLSYLFTGLEKQTLSLGHVRFSNDYQEFEFGLDVLDVDQNDRDAKIVAEEAFFLCLIPEADVRGMWSEYCKGEVGVCIGYDFKHPNYRWPDFYFRGTTQTPKVELKKTDTIQAYPYVFEIQQQNKDKEEAHLMWLTRLQQVVYTAEHMTGTKEISNEEKKLIDSDEIKSIDDVRTKLQFHPGKHSLIGYVKHWTFREEKEYRLLFRLTSDMEAGLKQIASNGLEELKSAPLATVRDYFLYPSVEKKADIKLGRNPRLIVKCKLSEEGLFRTKRDDSGAAPDVGDNENCCRYVAIVRAAHEPGFSEELIVREHPDGCGPNQVEWEKSEDFKTQISTALDKMFSESKISEGDCFVLGQGDDQEDIFNFLDKYLKKLKKRADYKIWCNGYPPIRRIIVERSSETAAIVESIKRYCSHIYWLKDVDVSASVIPYRKS